MFVKKSRNVISVIALSLMLAACSRGTILSPATASAATDTAESSMPIQMTDSAPGGSTGQPPGGNQPPGGGRPPRGGAPPQEAIAACSGMSENASCEFTTPRGSITGICSTVQSQLVCAPQGEPPSGEGPPPGEEPPGDDQPPSANSYILVDTGQNKCYDNTAETTCPQAGESFYGQDAQYNSVQPNYVDNGDSTVTDLNTGLMWQQTPDLDNKVTYAEAVAGAETFNLAGYDDWRLPTVKELYSLIDFNGSQFTKTPYIDTDYFDFRFGDESQGERSIDAQYWSSTEYIGTVFGGQAAVFGVNFADGRIKGYGLATPHGSSMTEFVRYVRGNPDYGVNDLNDNGDPSAGSGQASTISDLATGLMWIKTDSGATMNWESALGYCENLEYAGYDDWRLPNAKELQSIVDYTRAPDAQNPSQQGPAIDPIFDITETESWFWTSTTLLESPPDRGTGSQAVYLTFGQAFGVYNQSLVNVHGAGAQRSDPKSGDPADWADGFGPQNDQIRIYNYARCVRNGAQFTEATGSGTGEPEQPPTGNQPPPGGGQPPTGGHGTLPQEAIDACSGLSQDDICQFNSPRGTVTGVCALVQTQLACAPQGGPPRGSP